MNVFERLQQHFAKAVNVNRSSKAMSSSYGALNNVGSVPLNYESSDTNMNDVYDNNNKASQPVIVEQPPSSEDYMIGSNDNRNVPTTISQLAEYDGSQNYVPMSKNSTFKAKSVQNLTLIDAKRASGILNNSELDRSIKLGRKKRGKTSGSSFYWVSSDESDDNDGDDNNDENDKIKQGEELTETGPNDRQTAVDDVNNMASNALLSNRHSQRVKNSINRVKAALLNDFVNDTDDQLSSNLQKMNKSIWNLTGDDNEEEKDDKLMTHKTSITGELCELPSDISKKEVSDLNEDESTNFQSELIWSSTPGEPLSNLVADFRSNSPGTVYLIKTTCKRSDCRCALRNYNFLMLFPVLDTYLASATWEYWQPLSKHYNGPCPPNTCEVQAKLILFKQCLGWFEVLNENHMATPYLTTPEQVRRTKSSLFLVRQELRCQVAPKSLIIPEVYELAKFKEMTFPALPSDFLATASSQETLSNSKIDNVKMGSILRYIAYLPNCLLKRGKKMKEMGLLLFLERGYKSDRTSDSSKSKMCSRLIYLGVEDSAPSVYNSKLALSLIAGPENISGVHTVSRMLRKFRLPLSIKPCLFSTTTPQSTTIYQQHQQASKSKTNVSNSPTWSNNQKLFNSFKMNSTLALTDYHFFRLNSLYRGDILIITPMDSPERLFLITPSMLDDHLFQVGTCKNSEYLKKMANHRTQALNFLNIVHPLDTLNYLVRHMQDITREPRESCASKIQQPSSSSKPATCESMTPEELDDLYDEIDQIYFFIRNGYYPSKINKPEDSSPATKLEKQKSIKKVENAETKVSHLNRIALTTPDELLLAVSLYPAASHATAALNGASSAHRVQPKEYGI